MCGHRKCKACAHNTSEEPRAVAHLETKSTFTKLGTSRQKGYWVGDMEVVVIGVVVIGVVVIGVVLKECVIGDGVIVAVIWRWLLL